jgi:nucleoside-diphosphate-sugar epimerase
MRATPVFITGGPGYVGRPLIVALLERGHSVHALVRPGSEARLPPGAEPVGALVRAGETPPTAGVRIVGVPEIRRGLTA